jgi:hypothetical protein
MHTKWWWISSVVEGRVSVKRLRKKNGIKIMGEAIADAHTATSFFALAITTKFRV